MWIKGLKDHYIKHLIFFPLRPFFLAKIISVSPCSTDKWKIANKRHTFQDPFTKKRKKTDFIARDNIFVQEKENSYKSEQNKTALSYL